MAILLVEQNAHRALDAASRGYVLETGRIVLADRLISAAGGAWLTERKGYGERLGLLFGLVLSAVGLILALVLPGRPGSKWKREGPFPHRRRVTGP